MKMEVRKPTEEEKKEAENWPVWEKEESQFPWKYDTKETCLILEGEAEVESEGGAKIEFRAGDLVIFEPGLSCIWKIKKKIRKKYKLG